MSVKFQNGDIRDNGQLLGKLNGDVIRNATGTTLGRTRNDEIRSPVGALVGKVRDGSVYAANGSRIGSVNDYMIDGMQHEKDVNIVAAYHFLINKIF